MILLIAACVGLIFLGKELHMHALEIIAIDAIILLIPHWVTGLRRASVVINLGFSKKIEVINNVIADCKEQLKDHEIEYYMLLSGKDDVKVPKDVKFKIDLKIVECKSQSKVSHLNFPREL